MSQTRLDAAEAYYTGLWRRNVAIARKLNLRGQMQEERTAAAIAIRAIRAQRAKTETEPAKGAKVPMSSLHFMSFDLHHLNEDVSTKSWTSACGRIRVTYDRRPSPHKRWSVIITTSGFYIEERGSSESEIEKLAVTRLENIAKSASDMLPHGD